MNNTVTTVIIGYQALTDRLLHISHNAPFLRSAKPLRKQCLPFLLRQLQYPGEMKNKALGYAKLWFANETYYGRCANGKCQETKGRCW